MSNNGEDWGSLRGFARRRGVSLAAVQKAIESGRVKAVRRAANGRLVAIEANAATHEWNANTDVDQAARAGAPILPSSRTPDPERANAAAEAAPAAEDQGRTPTEEGRETARRSGGPVGGADSDDKHGYLEARARSEQFRAKQAELDYLMALGRVVSVEELQRVSARRYATMRDKLLNIPDSQAPLLAAERDSARVHATLTAAIKRVLNELADAAESEVAGGIAERVAA